LADTRGAAVAAPGRARPKTTRKPAAAAKPQPRARRRYRSRAGITWIVVGAVLLAGVVFVNLAVLRLNLRLDSATQERTKLRAENAALSSQLSSALASPRIQALARQQDGLTQADPSTIGYIDLSR
jgi:cell division protein FtsL